MVLACISSDFLLFLLKNWLVLSHHLDLKTSPPFLKKGQELPIPRSWDSETGGMGSPVAVATIRVWFQERQELVLHLLDTLYRGGCVSSSRLPCCFRKAVLKDFFY